MIGLKKPARLVLLGLGVLMFGTNAAHACIFQGSATPCAADCKEDGGEVECIAPIFKAKLANLQSDSKKWQYYNYNCYWRGGDNIYGHPWCAALGGQLVDWPNTVCQHGVDGAHANYAASYYKEGLVSSQANTYATSTYAQCGPASQVSDTGWGANDPACYGYNGVDNVPKFINGQEVFSRRRLEFDAPVKSYPPSGPGAGLQCLGEKFRVKITAGRIRDMECPAGTTWRELTSSFDANRIVRCVPDVMTDLNCAAGNPTGPGSGAKLETSVDYQGAGAHPLIFERKYNSRALTVADYPFSATAPWSHNYARTLQTHGVPNASGSTMAQLVLASSSMDQRLLYRQQANGTWLPDTPGNLNTLTELKDAAGVRTGWQHKRFADDAVENYSADGVLLSIKERNGWTTTLTYSDAATPAAIAPKPGLLISVKNHFGRELKFTYESATGPDGLPQARLKELLPPGAVSGSGAGLAQSPIVYKYEEAANLGTSITKQGQLTSVTWQDGTTKRYHYEASSNKPHHLTGITDEANVRIGTYTYLNGYYVGYQHDGKVGSTQKAGGAEKLEFSYSSGGTGYGTGSTRITDYSGPNGSAVTRTYTIQVKSGVARPTAVTAPCPLCGSTAAQTVWGDGSAATGGAGAKGQKFKEVAHDGTVTFYTYDAKGRETEKATFAASFAANATRPALSSATTVTSTQWHGTHNLPTRIAEPNKITAFTYANANATTGMGAGNLTGRSETTTTDATGAVKFAATQAAGTPIKSTGWSYNSTSSLPTTIVERETGFGATTAVETGRWTTTYNARGDTSSIKDVIRQTTATMTSYDPSGRLVSGTRADGVTLSNTYDFLGRLKMSSQGSTQMAFGYTTWGDILSISSSTGDSAQYIYDSNRQLTSIQVNGQNSTPSSTNLGNANMPMFNQKESLLSASTTSVPTDDPADYSSCSIYDQLAFKTKCKYDRVAAGICRFQNTGWSLAANGFLIACTANDQTPNRTGNCIRKCLAQAHLGSQNNGKCFKGRDGACLPCTSRSCIHEYHNKCFYECRVSQFCYGGNWYPLVPYGREN